MAVAGSLTYNTKLETDGLQKGLDKISASTVAIGNIMADAFKQVASAMGEVVKQGITYNAQIEQYQVALTTLTGSAEEANRIMTQIKEDAAKTPFDVAGLTQANQLLISAGVDADVARKDIIALGNAISATGGGNEELSRMAVNLQQIKNVGKASSLDIKQFAYAGIDLYGLLADYLGITKQEATELEITYETLTGALQFASEEGGKYFGAMEQQSLTLNGQISTLKDSFMMFAGEAATPLFDFLRSEALPILNSLLNGEAKVEEAIPRLANKILELISNALMGLIDMLPEIIKVGINIIISLIEGITEQMPTLIPAIIECILLIVQAILNNLDKIIIAGIDLIIALIEGLLSPKSLGMIVSSIPKIIASIVKAFLNLAPEVMKIGLNIVQGIWNGINNAKQWVLDKIKGFGKGILNGLKDFFGIKSPSRVMRDQIGQWLPKGIAVGIDANTDSALNSIDKMNDEIMNKMNQAVNMETAKASFSGTSGSVSQILSANSVIQVENYNTLELDGEVVYENQETVRQRKDLQYGFGGGTSK